MIQLSFSVEESESKVDLFAREVERKREAAAKEDVAATNTTGTSAPTNSNDTNQDVEMIDAAPSATSKREKGKGRA